MKVEEICRTCLSESSDLRSIFKLGVIAGKTTTLARVLMEFSKLMVDPADNFPDKMCYGCVIQANQSFSFLQTCLESDRYLREKLANNIEIEMKGKNNFHDETTMTEAETQTVYFCNSFDIDDENEINIQIEPSSESVSHQQKSDTNRLINSRKENTNGTNPPEIFVITEPEEQNENPSESIIPEIIEEVGLKTEILDEIENCDSTPSTYEIIQSEEYYEGEEFTVDDDDNKSNSDRETNDDDNLQNNENLQFIEIESNNIKLIKRRSKVATSSTKINIPGPPYPCSICQKQLSTKSSFRYHMQLHSDSTPFLCNECGEKFKTRNSYNGHMTTHNINNPHKCEICGKTYRQANSLKTHMLRHTGEKPFLCGICGKGMTQKSGYKKHMLVHSGELPFQCDICHKRFRYSSNLNAHRKTHNDKKSTINLCLSCNKICTSTSELTKHMLAEHPQDKNLKRSQRIFS